MLLVKLLRMMNGGHPRNKKDAGVCKALGVDPEYLIVFACSPFMDILLIV